MNVGVFVLDSLVVLGLGHRVYGGWVARRLGLEPSRPTPALTSAVGLPQPGFAADRRDRGSAVRAA